MKKIIAGILLMIWWILTPVLFLVTFGMIVLLGYWENTNNTLLNILKE